ncbi:unnamed protein product (macronuclear) [Paramecium tetraurelia]|uniref:Uncharacterized protein n=1 Tax=Paramecium tetraurelia TaxID=5888 RepID=A0BWY6_PARTE|nr:uncharacterized protein GSPATT00032905001 [Paramecium tetraurelia]CAK63053.1 unnamed protein product [Paramecium tetraurelia]|eukprot:XP_001430451.1 hypothetical protein (macronuclear) [Paramecium tetraurelia strain d4-2]
MKISIPNDPRFAYQKSHLSPYIDKSKSPYGIAKSPIQQGSPCNIKFNIYSALFPTYPQQNRNLSMSLFQTPSPQRLPQPMIQQSTPQSIGKPTIAPPSPLYLQQSQSPQSVQPRYQQLIQTQVPQVNISNYVYIAISLVREIEEVPVVHEVHHVNRPINVISMAEIEAPWRSKQILLEKQLIELQLVLKYGSPKKVETRHIIVEDESRIRELEQEIEKLKQLMRENEENIQNLESLVDQAQNNLENVEEQVQNQLEEQHAELARWRKKFQELNKKYHDLEEEITMTEAQIESIQKRAIITQSSSSKIISKSRVNQTSGSAVRVASVNKNF